MASSQSTSQRSDLEREVARLRARVVELERAQLAPERAWREGEERYQLLFQSAPIGLGVAALDGTILAFNEAMLLPGGYSPEDIARIGSVAALYHDPADRDRALEIARRDGRLRQFETRMKRRDGSPYDVLMSLDPITVDGQPAWLAMVEDITDRKRAAQAQRQAQDELESRVVERTAKLRAANVRLRQEAEARVRVEQSLRASEAKFRTLVSNVPDFIITLDRAGRLSFINRTTGDPIDDVVGRSALDFIPPESHAEFRSYYERVFSTGEPVQYEIPSRGTRGELRWYRSRMGPVFQDDQVEQVIIVATDVTEQRQAEVALQHEQRLLKQLLKQHEADRQLVAYEIHDGLVQYLTGAVMRIEAFAAAKNWPLEKLAAHVELTRGLIRRAIDDARRLISGLRPPVLDESGVVEAISYLVAEHLSAEQREIVFRHNMRTPRLAPLLESALFRICQEALNNAVRHSQAKRIDVGLVERDATIVLEVRDNGRGFNLADVTPKTFGLQGIRDRARLMGGSLVIDSQPGRGTRLTVELPLEPSVF